MHVRARYRRDQSPGHGGQREADPHEGRQRQQSLRGLWPVLGGWCDRHAPRLCLAAAARTGGSERIVGALGTAAGRRCTFATVRREPDSLRPVAAFPRRHRKERLADQGQDQDKSGGEGHRIHVRRWGPRPGSSTSDARQRIGGCTALSGIASGALVGYMVRPPGRGSTDGRRARSRGQSAGPGSRGTGRGAPGTSARPRRRRPRVWRRIFR